MQIFRPVQTTPPVAAMDSNYVNLSNVQVAAAVALIMINAIISLVFQLKLLRTLFLASLRTVGQLILLGLALDQIFAIERWYLVIALAAVMTSIAGLTAAGRIKNAYRGLRLNTVVSIFCSSWIVTAFALLVVIRSTEHWYQPQYAIPLLGMVLGNTLNGISVGLDSFTTAVVKDREQIEMRLTLGATRYEAASDAIRESIRSGLTPILNSMMVVGIVSLPGMMTGQLIAGMNPMQAVRYQIVIMFLVASATILGTMLTVLLSFMKLTEPHRMRDIQS